MFQAIYTSRARDDVGTGDMFDIAERAAVNNHKHKVSGLLLFHQGEILQILEGDKNVVQELIRKIKADPRHTDFILMLERSRDRRSFPDWSLQLKCIEDSNEIAYFELMLRELKNASPEKENIKLRALTKNIVDVPNH